MADDIDYARTPTGRSFGAPGSLSAGGPSLLERRQAITDFANDERHGRNLYRRLWRELNRRSRRGDVEAGFDAIKLMDTAKLDGVEMTGIPNHRNLTNEAETGLVDEMRNNDAMNAAANGDEQEPVDQTQDPDAIRQDPQIQEEDPPVGDPEAMPGNPEAMPRSPATADESIVGGQSGIPAPSMRQGPDPSQGGLMAARKRASGSGGVKPIFSSRTGTPYGTDPDASWRPVSPEAQAAAGGPPLIAGPPKPSADDLFTRRFPAIAGFMDRAKKLGMGRPAATK